MKSYNNNVSLEKILNAVRNGQPIYVKPYKEPKIWGEGGIGEYWYGAEEGNKSSTAIVGEEAYSLHEIVKNDPEKFLGEKVVERFGEQLPLVKILTPKGRLSVQFHDEKNELWIVTGTDKMIAGGKPWITIGFSQESVDLHGKDVTRHFKETLEAYGEKLNSLIDIMINSGCEELLEDKKNVELAAVEAIRKGPESSKMSEVLEELKTARKKLDVFYNRQYVEVGDVIPIPSMTLHALGPGVTVVEPQIAGPTQSLEDGATYPVRYAFPAYPRNGYKKMLDIDRVGEMNPEVTKKAFPVVIEETNHVVVERLPGEFENKGLEVHRISLKIGAEFQRSLTSFHNIVAINGNAHIIIDDEEYIIPKALPGGNMLIVPATIKNYKILARENVQIIDTFTPT